MSPCALFEGRASHRPSLAPAAVASSSSSSSSSILLLLQSYSSRRNLGRRLSFNAARGMGMTKVDSMTRLPSWASKISYTNAILLGESLASEENDLVFPSPEFSAQSIVSSPEQYAEMYKKSVDDPAGFWSEIASQFYWKKKWDPDVFFENLDARKGNIKIEWFMGGITNICYNALDRNIEEGNGDKVAIFWEGNEPGQDGKLTYNELLEKVCQLSNYLKDVGVRKGDTVVIYLPMVVELPISMLACARIGAVHSVVFAGFSSESLTQRIMDCKPKIVITCNGVCRGSKVLLLKDFVDIALVQCAKNDCVVGLCLTYENKSAMTRDATNWQDGRDVWWQDVVPKFSTKCDVEWVESEDPLFILYTSGSTGKPKGVLHTTGGYMVYSATTFKYAFDYKPSDIYWCTADCGWITGHSYVTYGPLLNGATIIVFEGVPNYPNPGRCWDIVDKYMVTLFYTAPTLVRSLMRDGNEHVTRHSRKSLRVLGTVGEPINPSAWRWLFNVVGNAKCPISDTWWQTETGGFMITPLPGSWPQKPGSATFPFFGAQVVIVDEKGDPLEGECSGYLCIKRSWPGAFRTLYGDHHRYETTYFNPFLGYYFSGDGCRRDKDGYYWLTGRVDDVINVSGHRIGTAEVESALVSHPQCAEAAVVGIEHEVKGQGIYAFVTLLEGVPCSEELRRSLISAVRNQLMILVDDAGGIFPFLNHSPWDGVAIADFVMPFFLFIVGVSLGLTCKRVSNRITATRNVLFRALKLFAMGLLLQGGYFHGVRDLTFGVDLLHIRFMGVLQRIAIAYLLAALCEVWHRSSVLVDSGHSLIKRYKVQLLIVALLTAAYIFLVYGLFVPDWDYNITLPNGNSKSYSVKCGVRGYTSPACNAAGMIDRKLLGADHLYKRPVYGRTKECSVNSPRSGPLPEGAPAWCKAPFDPEGLLSTIMAVVTCFVGLHYGHVIVHFKHGKDRMVQWMIPSVFLQALAFCLHFCGMRMNKALYSASYACVTAGASGLLLAGIYLLVDVCGLRRPMLVLEWMGKHALAIYVLVACNLLPFFIQGFYWKQPANNLLSLIGIVDHHNG